ncbi:excitatory amino acid transporter isoform X1 [Metopolophium dirhodum]|uniref:excitatory amino acid transporter isoform X1 n=2 Tax=Metopolophium dirhodum TaxID=44670 RepID=UPI00298F9B9E|nr:excitatory amino acid transporter isoform X1 [Metopolophium dirhodum]
MKIKHASNNIDDMERQRAESTFTIISKVKNSPNVNTAVKWLSSNKLLIFILVSVVFGVILGLILRPLNLSSDIITLISYPGDLFLRTLKLMVLPFIISCLIIGAANLDISKNGNVAIRTIVYFVLTSVFNVCLGLTLGLLVHPGSPDLRYTNTTSFSGPKKMNVMDGFLDMGKNLLPENLFQATIQQTLTEYETVMGENNTKTLKKVVKYKDGTNTLGIIFFCLIFGTVLGTMGERKRPVLNFFTVTYEVMQKILTGVIWFTPIGVASVICGKIITQAQLTTTLVQLSLFIATTVGGFLFYQLIVIQVIYFVIVKKSPWPYYVSLGPALATAFATASKSASLPITFKVLDEKLKMNPKITKFVLPIGTINMDGSALYLSVALLFLAQINNLQLGIGEIFTIGLACTAASMSSAAIPSAAIVLVVMLCSVINIPTEDVSMLFAVDWLVDRFRTMNNLIGDCYTVAIVQHLSKEELEQDDEKEAEEAHVNGTFVMQEQEQNPQTNQSFSTNTPV